MSNADNLAEIASMHPDYMGFIFYEPSPRNCIGIDPSIISNLPEFVESVMVSVDMKEDEILDIVRKYRFRTVQLHGNESPVMCRHLRSSGLRVIKAIGMHSVENLAMLRDYENSVDIFLLDTMTPSKGGSGKKFDWRILEAYDLNPPFMLSGGIGPEDTDAIFKIKNPKFEGIDLNSRFESSPGIKNASLLQHFLSQLKNKL